MRSLRDYTRLKTTPPEGPDELAWSLVLDHLIFAAEAEVRWLDHVESRAGRTVVEPVAAPAESRAKVRR